MRERSFAAMTSSTLTLREATVADAAQYAAVARQTFVETYGASTDPVQLATHLAANFSEALQRAELVDPDRVVLALESPEGWVGFVALQRGDGPPCVTAARPLQLARIYVVREWQGTGVGRRLLDSALDFARTHGHDALWLQVWTENHRAHAFYTRAGFAQVGTFPFKFGDEYEDDLVFSRAP